MNITEKVKKYRGYAITLLLSVSILLFVFLQITPNSNELISEKKRIELFTEIAKNNTKSFYFRDRILGEIEFEENTINSIERTALPLPNQLNFDLEIASVLAPDTDLYNYRKVVSTLELGTKTCNALVLPDRSGITTDIAYFNDSSSYYFYNSSTEQSTSAVAKYSDSESEVLVSSGGMYDVKIYYPLPDTFSNNLSSEIIENYFGSNLPEVKDAYKENGITYYVLEHTQSAYCNEFDSFVSTIIVRNVINAQSYEVVSKTVYVNAVGQQNILYSETMQSERKRIDAFSAIEDEFSLEQDRIEILDYRNAPESSNAIDTQVTESIITPPNHQLTKLSSNLSEPIVNELFFLDADFYPNSDSGESLLKKAQYLSFLEPLASYESINENEYFNAYIFEQSEATELMESKLSGMNPQLETNITINNREVLAQSFSDTQLDSSNYPSSYPVSYPKETPKNNVLLFKYNDSYYIITTNSNVFMLTSADFDQNEVQIELNNRLSTDFLLL